MQRKHFDFPLVIQNKLVNWEIFNYTSDDWCDLFKDKVLKFREGNKTYSETPFWDYLCNNKEMTLKEFFELSSKNSDHWLYFDYKYIKDVFGDNKSLMKKINWDHLGLVGFSGEDSTLWIGNEGAHTPCHVDTYGCNFVAQIFGRKLWVLIPPDETSHLEPVRVPYEESSIYSACNFYTPNDKLLGVKEAYKVILEPGDVLYVPKSWWHYVENLEVAISINIWVPLDDDHESRVEESLVRHYVSNICAELSKEESEQILNPNEYDLILNCCSLDLIKNCIENYNTCRNGNENKNAVIKDIKRQLKNDLRQLDLLDIKSYLKEKSGEHNYSTSMKKTNEVELDSKVSLAKTLINSFCHPFNINLIKKCLLKEN